MTLKKPWQVLQWRNLLRLRQFLVPWLSVGSWIPCVLGMGGAQQAPHALVLGFVTGTACMVWQAPSTNISSRPTQTVHHQDHALTINGPGVTKRLLTEQKVTAGSPLQDGRTPRLGKTSRQCDQDTTASQPASNSNENPAGIAGNPPPAARPGRTTHH